MTKHFIYILLLLLCSSTLMVAQNNAIFNGGSTDGHIKDCYSQPSNLNTTLSRGGNGDGHSKDCYVQTSNLNSGLSAGGDGDGHSKDCYTQTSNLHVINYGGDGDGSAKDCYTQSPVLTVNFNGGSNDGYAKDCYTQTSNLNPIFSGGIGGDGQLNGCANEPLGCFLAINLGNDTTFCTGQTLTLDAGSFPGGATYEWQDSSFAQTFLVDTSGTYYVFVTDTAGCTGIDSIIVTVNPVPVVSLGNDTAFCAGNNLILDAGNAGATYLWQNNPIPAYQNQTLTVNSTGIYFVTASFGTCTDTDSISVTVNPIVTTNLPDSIICQGDSTLIFGTYQTVAGTYRDTVLASTGCDSILVQQLNVNPTYNQNLGTVTICSGDSALILGNYETVAGTYSNTYQSINGCDSIVSQTLNVSPIHVVDLGNDTAFCAGNNLTLNASVGASSYQWINGVGFPYNQQTFTVSSTGTYYVVTTLGACTTSDTINVTVHPIVTTNLTNEVVCQGDSALIFGTYQTVAGNYYDTLVASTGCDSILVKQLIVNPIYNVNLGSTTICSGDSALILGNYETVAGTYSDTLTSINGCDSIVSQTLNVSPIHVVDLGNDTAFCAGNSLTLNANAGAGSYQWINGVGFPYNQQTFTVSSTGTYYVVTTLGACTTSDTINVTVHPIVTNNLANEVVCQGDSALIFGNYQTVAGNYYDTLTASTGCDSILVKQLIVNPVYNINLGTTTICSGDSALIFGNYETVAGTYADTLMSINGCDSIVSQTLAVLSNSSVNLGNDTTFCAGNSLLLDAGSGNSYLWQDGFTSTQTYLVTSSGLYSVTVSLGACSATDSINITVNPILTTNLANEVVCQGDSALIFGSYQTVVGNYYDTLIASTGCDSILLKQLIVNPTYNQNLGTVNICQGDSALILGNYETVAGTYSDTLTSINGCDSIVSQTLNVSPSHNFNLGNDTAFCAGNSLLLDASAGASSYQWINGVGFPYNQQTFTVSSTGTYYVVTTLGACTTSDTINVTVNPIQTTVIGSYTICQGDSQLIFGNYQTVAGFYNDTIVASTGCDSILSEQLIVNPIYNYSLSPVSICLGDSALIFGNYYSVAGTYYDSTTTIFGCDSIVAQELIVNPYHVIDLGADTTICENSTILLDAGAGADTYIWQSTPLPRYMNQTFSAAGAGMYYVVATIGICSSSDTINVSVIPTVYTNLTNVEICQGDSALIFGNYETVAGTYNQVLVASTGCDSILVQPLIVHPNYFVPQSFAICQGDSIMLGGVYQNSAGTYYDTLQSVNTCDSIIATTLIVNPTYTINTSATICDGDSILLGGSYQTIAGVYTDIYSSINGCDSTVNTTLIVNPVYVINQNIEICAGDSIYLGGAYQNTTGVYTDVYSSIFGCDSIVVTTLGIKAIATNTLTPITICDNDSALIFGNYQTVAGMYSTVIPNGAVNGCDSIVYQELMVNPTYQFFANTTICSGDSIFLGGFYQTTAGVYVDVYTSSLGCDSTITTTLNVINSFTININDTICAGDSILLAGAYQTIAGTYTELLVSTGGCDSLVITELYVNPLPIVTLTADPELILSGQSSQLTATGGGLYSWTPTTGLSCSNCDSPVASPTETTLYTVEVNLNGCMVSDTITISVDSEFKIPEGFSPNGDGVNDVFEIVGISQFPNNKIMIVNRWGDKVFEAAPYKSDWDGTSQFGIIIGEKLPSGTYFYVLDLGKVGPSGSQEIKGYIYINR